MILKRTKDFVVKIILGNSFIFYGMEVLTINRDVGAWPRRLCIISV